MSDPFRTDRARLLWCVQRSAQVFFREAPEKMCRVAHMPNGQDGYIAGEVEDREIPGTFGPVVRVAAHATRDAAIVAAIDAAMDDDAARPHPVAHWRLA